MRTITNIGNSGRDITNGADLNALEADLPLNIVEDPTGESNDSINLGGLTSYGTTGQVMKVNSDTDGLVWEDDEDTTYTVVNPLTLSDQNAISLSNLTGFGTEGQFLKSGPGNTLVYGSDNNTTYTVVNPLTLSDQNAISLSNLTGFGTEGQFLKSGPGNTLVYGSDNNTTYTVVNPLTLSDQNAISLSNLTGFGQAGQVLRVTTGANGLEYSDETVKSATTPLVITNGSIKLNGLSGYGGGIGVGGVRQLIRTNANADGLEYYDEPDLSNFVTATSTTTFTNKSMSYSQITGRPFEISYSAGLLFANYLGIFKTVSNRCILFSNSSSKYRHGIKHNDTNLEFYLSTTNDAYTGLNKKLTIGLTSIQPSVDISLLAIGNATGVSQIIKFNNDDFNTIGANFYTEVGNGGGLEIKGYAIIENSITRTDTTKNMRTILSNNGFHVLKGTDLVNDKTLLLLRDGATNYLGHVSNNLIIDGYDISIGSASGLMKLRATTLEYYYYNTSNMIFTAKLYDNKYEFQAQNFRCPGELNMRDNSTLGRINMCDGPIFWRNRYKSGDNTYVTDTNHYSQYSSSPIDGIRHQGWTGVSLGYTTFGGGTALYTYGSGVYFGNGSAVSSDDRIKFNETRITGDALETINKLVVVEYDKRYNRDLPETQYGKDSENHLLNDTAQKEYGYIAQDTWNNIPELRFTVKGVDETIPENFVDGRLIEDCKVRNKNSEGEQFIDRKYLSIDYNNINVLNVRAVQELSQIVNQQREQIAKQQAQIELLLKFNNLSLE